MKETIIEFTRKAAKSLTDYQKEQVLRSEWFANCSDNYIPDNLVSIDDADELIDRLQSVFTDNDFAEILADYIIDTISDNSNDEFDFDITTLI
jgi:hypothetical protein